MVKNIGEFPLPLALREFLHAERRDMEAGSILWRARRDMEILDRVIAASLSHLVELTHLMKGDDAATTRDQDVDEMTIDQINFNIDQDCLALVALEIEMVKDQAVVDEFGAVRKSWILHTKVINLSSLCYWPQRNTPKLPRE